MNYLEFKFTVNPIDPFRDMLLFQLNELDFETHEEVDNGLVSYVKKDLLVLENLASMIEDFPVVVGFESKEIEQENWNQKWEEAFDPVIVDDTCIICAPFHDVEGYQYKILVHPKMAFGTGHHATTYLISKTLLSENLKGKEVLDMGCGTAVLAVLAEKLGASKVDGIDIDEWAYANAIENCTLNNTTNINIEQGGAELLHNRLYNVILANINKNVLLRDMMQYCNVLAPNGVILFSGFYEKDLEDVKNCGEQFGLTFDRFEVHNEWTMLKMIKK